MKKNSGDGRRNGPPPMKNWSSEVAPERDYELRDGENIETVETEMKASNEDYNIWLSGTKGKQRNPARWSRNVGGKKE